MRTGLAIRQDEVLQNALAALARTTGLHGKAKQAAARGTNCGDALVEIPTGGQRHLFLAKVKDVRHFATVAMVKEQLAGANRRLRPLLVAPYMTRTLAEYCRTIQLPFLDTAGNACLEAPGLIVYVTGEPRPADVQDRVRYRAFTLAGMKIVFAMLCRPQLADGTYRDVAKAAGVALGAVGPVMRDLETRGFLVVRTKKVLTDTRKLIDEWVTRFPDTLRPKLLPQRYQADTNRLLTLNVEAHHSYWGGEMAGQRLTGYLKPERFMLYLEKRDKALLVQARMRLDPAGNTEMLQAFWNLPRDEAHPDTVPPLLAYADLMATGEGRNMETARLIYDQFLEAIQDR